MKWSSSAPANIALIKYMGKLDYNGNRPANISFSYTLEHLTSTVELELNPQGKDHWEPLNNSSTYTLSLNPQAKERFLKHLQRIKSVLEGQHYHFLVRSGNNFPENCGLASSASSYAALTMAACQAITELLHKEPFTIEKLAALSQQGSGSSCRSFFAPWCVWEENKVNAVDLPYPKLLHQVIIISQSQKLVSSSAAHRAVATSLLFSNRPQRANQRFRKLITSLQNQDWHDAFITTWQEFWDMHSLFETANPPFGYMTADSLKVLRVLQSLWHEQKDGPLITLDAGPNIHLLYRLDQSHLASAIKAHLSEYSIFEG